MSTPDEGDDDHRGIFGLRSPGLVLSVCVVLILFGGLFAAAWWAGAFDCHNFAACPQLQR